MALMEDKSVDMILCDLPYGITSCRWDSLLPLDQLWIQYKRVIKDNGAIVLTSAQPFTTKLIGSNPRMFRYTWYWVKNIATGFPFAKYQPMRCVEDICVFYKKAPTYHPQGLVELEKPIKGRSRDHGKDCIYKTSTLGNEHLVQFTNYPKNVLSFKSERGLHPTQKPVGLFEYLIKTYTDEGAVVLDNCIGSGTTAIACINANRKYIGFEIDQTIYQVAEQRIYDKLKGNQ